MVRSGHHFIYGSLRESIIEQVHGPALQRYLCNKFHWSDEVFHMIDWSAMGSYMRRVDGVKATNIIKLVMNWQNDGHQNELFYSTGGVCPACNNVVENHLHFLCCRDPVLSRMNVASTTRFYRAMKRVHTAGVLASVFKCILAALLAGVPPAPFVGKDDTIGRLLTAAWVEQEQIGWDNWAKGRFSRKWGEAQELYYRSNPDTCEKKHCSGRVWMVRMIGEVLSMVLQMWASRCGCLHGHDQKEKKLTQKEVVGRAVTACYLARNSIPDIHQDIFARPLKDMLDTCNLSYL